MGGGLGWEACICSSVGREAECWSSLVLVPSERCVLATSRSVKFSSLMDLYHQQNKCVINASILKKNPLWPHICFISPSPFIAKWQGRFDFSLFSLPGVPSPSIFSSLPLWVTNHQHIAKTMVCFWFSFYSISQQCLMWFLLSSVFLYVWSPPRLSSPLLNSSHTVPNTPLSDLESLLFSFYMSSHVILSGFKYYYHTYHTRYTIPYHTHHKDHLMVPAPPCLRSALGLMCLMCYLQSDIPSFSAESHLNSCLNFYNLYSCIYMIVKSCIPLSWLLCKTQYQNIFLLNIS